jgi:hypothetical protein
MAAIRITIAAFAAGLTASAAQAASIGLDVKTGLWEMTSTGKTKGATSSLLPTEVLEHLSAGVRRRIDSAMAEGMKHVDKQRVTKKCVTKETLKRGIKFNDELDGACKDTLVSNTAEVMEMRLQCKDPRADGSYRLQAVSREEVSGTMTMKVNSGSGSMTMTRDMHGRWLGADCGNVKPE